MLGPEGLAKASPLQLAELANEALDGLVDGAPNKPTLTEQRQLLRDVVDAMRAERAAAAPAAEAEPEPELDRLADPLAESAREERARAEEQARAAGEGAGDAAPHAAHRHLGRLGTGAGGASQPDRRDRRGDHRRPEIQLNATELRSIVRLLVDDMVGLGPLEPLLHDESVTDIMVNGPHQVYVERKGKVELTEVVFRDDPHVLHVATRIVTEVGRRVDESRRWSTPA